MTANRFFLPRPAEPGSLVWVEGSEHHHLCRVARVRRGESIGLFDGGGKVYRAVVEECGSRRTLLRVLSREDIPAPRTSITLALSLLKPPALETVVQKATELGVSRLALVVSKRTEVKPREGGGARLDRWRRISREAAKQCKSGLVPEISPPLSLEEYLRGEGAAMKLVLSERGGVLLREFLAPAAGMPNGPPATVSLLVGPEGGWTEGEEELVLGHGFRPVSLGGSVLRSETAAVCALSLVSHFWVA